MWISESCFTNEFIFKLSGAIFKRICIFNVKMVHLGKTYYGIDSIASVLLFMRTDSFTDNCPSTNGNIVQYLLLFSH